MSAAVRDIAEARAVHLADVLKALANPARLRIVSVLCGGERCVGDLATVLRLRQSIVSQQLRILRMQGLVGARRDGGQVRYRLTEPRLHQMMDCLSGCRAGKTAE